VYLLDFTSHRLLATLPPQAGLVKDARAAVTHLDFLADGLSLVSQWDGGAAVYSLAAGGLTWSLGLPVTVLAVHARSLQLALGTLPSSVVMMDGKGAPEGGIGLLGGLRLSAARFWQAPQNHDLAPGLMLLNDARQFSAIQAATEEPSHAGQKGAMPPAAPAPLDGEQGSDGVRRAALSIPTSQAMPMLKPADTSLVAGCQGRASHLLASVAELCPAALEQLLLS
jgi:hypothetical protein